MVTGRNKPLMRNLGEFFGHIIKAVRTDPAGKKKILKKEVQEEDRGDLILRRTTIEEVQIKPQPDAADEPPAGAHPSDDEQPCQ